MKLPIILFSALSVAISSVLAVDGASPSSLAPPATSFPVFSAIPPSLVHSYTPSGSKRTETPQPDINPDEVLGCKLPEGCDDSDKAASVTTWTLPSGTHLPEGCYNKMPYPLNIQYCYSLLSATPGMWAASLEESLTRKASFKIPPPKPSHKIPHPHIITKKSRAIPVSTSKTMFVNPIRPSDIPSTFAIPVSTSKTMFVNPIRPSDVPSTFATEVASRK
ncbi:hypothetical protein P280DRAFT_469269 [Massarina eburnea CBS 473.64]|uniref:Uncharacterized protein n=1 Tax=Massarina eburnea CBS 473.64 TaxID=1395130 RepID=A0A6A6RYU8_9PLEO|nr:hypothetical protein P280DRAFT_469269 [Massarina eburnea CBS 473.64]